MDEFESLPIIDKLEFDDNEFIDLMNNKKNEQTKEDSNE